MVNVNLIVRDTSRLLVDFCYTQLIFFIFKSHTEIHPKTYAFAQHLQTVGMKSSGALGWKHFVWVIEVLQKSKQHFPISFYATLDQDVLDHDDDAWDDDVGNHDRWSGTVDDQSDVVAGSDHWWSSGLAFKTAWTGFPNNVIVPQIHKHTNTKIHNQTNTQTHNYTKHTNTFDHWS